MTTNEEVSLRWHLLNDVNNYKKLLKNNFQCLPENVTCINQLQGNARSWFIFFQEIQH